MIGVTQANGSNFQQSFDNYVKGIAQSNNYQMKSNYSNTTLNGRNGLAVVVGGRSTVTNRNELVTIYGSQLNNGSIFYVITVSPEDQATSYQPAFRNIIRSVRLNG